jgi:predicted metalloenzyme YecM
MTKSELYTKLQDYITLFDTFCEQYSVDIRNILIDHVCYTCASSAEFEEVRSMFEFDDAFMHQSIISGRRIAYIGLGKPFSSSCGPVYYLELSDQKPNGKQSSKCHHIEPVPAGITYQDMLERFVNTGLPVEESIKPHHSTHDIKLENGLHIRISRERLIQKISRDEMVLEK